MPTPGVHIDTPRTFITPLDSPHSFGPQALENVRLCVGGFAPDRVLFVGTCSGDPRAGDVLWAVTNVT